MYHFQVRINDDLHARLDQLREEFGLPTLQELGVHAFMELLRSGPRAAENPALRDLEPEQYRLVIETAVLLKGRPEIAPALRALIDVLAVDRRR